MESLILNLTYNKFYGLQITRRIGKDLRKRRKIFSSKTKKYKSFKYIS